MPLIEHIRELRNRLVKALLALMAGMALGIVFFNQLFAFLQRPYCEARPGAQCDLFYFGILEPLTFRLKVGFIVGMVVASPVWMYQLWAFITPGMHRSERRYALAFVGMGVPFFAGGVALAYYTVDKGLGFFIGLLGSATELNLKAGQYLTFVTVIMLVFGISFLIPLLVTTLNLAGILSYERLKAWRRYIVFGVCVFAAVATPSQDPFTMLALAIPMAVLMEIATLLAKFNDRRRDRRAGVAAYEQLGDDETSPLDLDDTQFDDTRPDEGPPDDGPLDDRDLEPDDPESDNR